MKKIAIIISIFLGIVFLSGCGQSQVTQNQLNIDKEKIITTNTSSFKFFSLKASTGLGVAGNIYLNGKKLHTFTDVGSQISSNEPQDIIKDGENEIKLNVKVELEKFKPVAQTDSVIQIYIHALNDTGFPSKKNRVVSITWNPTDGKSEFTKIYSFNIKRSD